MDRDSPRKEERRSQVDLMLKIPIGLSDVLDRLPAKYSSRVHEDVNSTPRIHGGLEESSRGVRCA